MAKFHDPLFQGEVIWGKKCKINVFLKKNLLHSQSLIWQTKYEVMMKLEGSTKIVIFMTPRAEFLVQGRGHMSHIVKMHYFFKIIFVYSQV